MNAEQPFKIESTPEKRGIECPKCGCRHFYVVYTRAVSGARLMRRRECRHCARRLTTYESVVSNALAERE